MESARCWASQGHEESVRIYARGQGGQQGRLRRDRMRGRQRLSEISDRAEVTEHVLIALQAFHQRTPKLETRVQGGLPGARLPLFQTSVRTNGMPEIKFSDSERLAIERAIKGRK